MKFCRPCRGSERHQVIRFVATTSADEPSIPDGTITDNHYATRRAFLDCPISTRYGRPERQGKWVVRDRSGLRGGIFVDRAEALRFAMFEEGNRPQAVIVVAGVFELDMRARAGQEAIVTQKLRPS